MILVTVSGGANSSNNSSILPSSRHAISLALRSSAVERITIKNTIFLFRDGTRERDFVADPSTPLRAAPRNDAVLPTYLVSSPHHHGF
jgi:hypothetical protein